MSSRAWTKGYSICSILFLQNWLSQAQPGWPQARKEARTAIPVFLTSPLRKVSAEMRQKPTLLRLCPLQIVGSLTKGWVLNSAKHPLEFHCLLDSSWKPLSEEGGGKPVPHSVCQFFWWAVGVMQQQDICVRDIALGSIWGTVLWCLYIVCSLAGMSRRQGRAGSRCWLLYPHLRIDFCKKLDIYALALMMSWIYPMF